MKKNDIDKIEEIINYKFKNKDLLKIALTHKTYAFEAQMPLEYNERLEFLGDSILEFIVSEMIYRSNKFFSEGELTRRRAMIVNNNFLAKKAIELKIGSFLLLGRGEKKQNGYKNPTNLANALEALIGAIYLDSGIKNTKKILMKNIFKNSLSF
jgi:ribonuclease-3